MRPWGRSCLNRVMQNYVKLNQEGRDKILELMDDFVQIDKYKQKVKKKP